VAAIAASQLNEVNVIDSAKTVVACTSTQNEPEIAKNQKAIGRQSGTNREQHARGPNPGFQWWPICVHLLYLLNPRCHDRNFNDATP